ncbi:hypothetical protein AVEN_46241-1 [Araneus ventricosus]|uniref:Uncharacterized protein n=1 Tax=Araneus ventricosus TaxID=182803 RepID=A0A4Y2M0T4_ARAVE|nr:hypothetical protein AVEN_46241-1 [Araneus ventricosus]
MAVNSSHDKGGGVWPAGISASVHSNAAEKFAKPRAVETPRLFEISMTTIHKYKLQAIRRLPSHTPWEQSIQQVQVEKQRQVH